MDDWESWEKEDYVKDYVKAVNELTEKMDEDARGLLTEELETMKYTPSDNPRLDAELNLLKAEKNLASKKQKLGPGFNSYIKFKAKADGKSVAAVRRWANRVISQDD